MWSLFPKQLCPASISFPLYSENLEERRRSPSPNCDEHGSQEMQVAFFYSILNPRSAGILGRARHAGVGVDPVPLPSSQTSYYSEAAIESSQRVILGNFKKY